MRPSFGKVPTGYRSVLQFLHWATLGLLIALLAAGNLAVLKWSFVATVILWLLGYGAFGVQAKPGPVLTGTFRRLFVPSHILMLGLPGILAVMLFDAGPGALSGSTRIVAILTLGAGLLHGVFHLWRHTALGDGALRNMVPKSMHGML